MTGILDSNWLRALLYFAAAMLCLIVGGIRRRETGEWTRAVVFWLGLAALLALLGVGRLGDLGPWLTDQGREIATSQGWYDERRRVQSTAVEGVLLLSAIAIGLGLLWFFWSASREHPLAFIAIVFLLTYVAIRAISWHTTDQVLYSHPFGGPHPNALIEIAGVVLMCVAAAWALLKLVRSGSDHPKTLAEQ